MKVVVNDLRSDCENMTPNINLTIIHRTLIPKRGFKISVKLKNEILTIRSGIGVRGKQMTFFEKMDQVVL